MARLKEKYKTEILPALIKEFQYKSIMAVPKIEKVVVNMGLGEAITNPKLLDVASGELAAIMGQKPVIRRARKAIASFKLRQGMPIGVMVTVRGDRMYEFIDRLVNIVLPRVRDFRGLSSEAFDGRGNYTLGLIDQQIFPEIDMVKTEQMRGMNITVVTTARGNEEALFLLSQMGMPFAKEMEQAATG
ncbi:MAG: 50S ribosomal protein L5 [Acidobacteriota bacterium]|nr:50S ribosomal protein L5 [Acidobacteriota bacterium]